MSTSAKLHASAPTRLDFGGGWTDVPPIPEERGGFVCNLAIERRAHIALSASDRPLPTSAIPLVAAALNHLGVTGVVATVASDFPIGAGLGGSSALAVATLAAAAAWRAQPLSAAQLAEQSRAIEVEELGIAGGRQDHYAAAFGGALGLSFTAEVAVQPIALTADTVAALERRCLVFYTGESRMSGDTIQAVLDQYRAKDRQVLFSLSRMSSLARLMATALTLGDVDALGALVGEHWRFQRSLHPAIPTERIDTLIHRSLQAGALGAKALGASGGGCVLVIAADGREADVRSAVGSLGEELPVTLSLQGVSVRDDRESTG